MTTNVHAPVSLRLRVLRGAAWTTSAAVSVQVSRLIFGVALARLLTPHEYGIAGMALVFSALILGISDLGLGAGLVQRATITEADRSTVFWTSVAVGFALAGIGLALSAPLAAFFGEPAVRPLFAAVSTGFVVTALGRAHAALYLRDMAFRAISVRTIAATVAGGIVAVVIAALGHGAWALVGMHLANGVVTTTLLWCFSPWQPRLMFSLSSLRALSAFGLNVLGARVFEYLHFNGDKVLVGRFLGSSSLGFYNVAFNLVVLPFSALLLALIDTLFPAMSRVQQDHARVATGWLRATRMLVAITTPAMLGLVVVAPDFVAVLLGHKWDPAIPVLQLLAVAMAIYAAAAFSTTVLMAVDRTGTNLRFTICEMAVIALALVIGLRWGIAGVAAGYLSAIIVTRSSLQWLTARTLGISPLLLAKTLVGAVHAALGMLVIVWAARTVLVELDVPAAVRLVAVPVIGMLVYPPLCAWRSPEVLRDFEEDVRVGGIVRLARRVRGLLPS
jgi:O-antigen/teichoic acid export membrane protein